jgi:hypothetical protein
MMNNNIIVIHHVWHLKSSSSWCAVDMAGAHFIGDVVLPHHLRCACCGWQVWLEVATGDDDDDDVMVTMRGGR